MLVCCLKCDEHTLKERKSCQRELGRCEAINPRTHRKLRTCEGHLTDLQVTVHHGHPATSSTKPAPTRGLAETHLTLNHFHRGKKDIVIGQHDYFPGQVIVEENLLILFL